jgi:hypothetical protein
MFQICACTRITVELTERQQSKFRVYELSRDDARKNKYQTSARVTKSQHMVKCFRPFLHSDAPSIRPILVATDDPSQQGSNDLSLYKKNIILLCTEETIALSPNRIRTVILRMMNVLYWNDAEERYCDSK